MIKSSIPFDMDTIIGTFRVVDNNRSFNSDYMQLSCL